jgi:hypothetical protein
MLAVPLLTLYVPNSTEKRTAGTTHRHGPMMLHSRRGTNVNSSNWGGWAITGAQGSVSQVAGSWVVPRAYCSGSQDNSQSSIWIGIDGYTSATVEQIGTDSDCVNGVPSYYAWYEFYPHNWYTIKMTVSPDQKIWAEVTNDAKKGQFTVKLNNVTTNKSFSISAKMPSAKANSAEWIIEAPWTGGILPLTNFGLIQLGQDHTQLPSPYALTNYATVGGVLKPLGWYSANQKENTFRVTMVDKNGNPKVDIQPPDLLDPAATSFTAQWFRPGP